jgi:hypothetical protein
MSKDNFEVHDPQIESLLREIGHLIAKELPKGKGFTLLFFDFGDNGNMFYISNAERKDMIGSMKEFIAKNSD